MKIVIAPDAFKGSLSALEVATAIQKGINSVDNSIETVLVPMADGGEGTVQSLIDATGGKIVELIVHDPLFREIKAFYGILGDNTTAVIEMAAASGLPLLSMAERNPLKTTSFGTGELIKDALNKGCTKIIIGLGGSATIDGGCGMAQALGVRFTDGDGKVLVFGGEGLGNLQNIDISKIDERLKYCEIIAACDVDNPLCGMQGAAKVYGPQKGATPMMTETLDNNLFRFANIVKIQLGKDIESTNGAGAAGGMGAGVIVFLNAKLVRGIDIVIKITNLANALENATLLITGEGMIDYQTAFGKTPFGVAQLAKLFNIPVVAIAGSLGRDYQTLYSKGFDAIYSIVNKPMMLEEAMQRGVELLEETTKNIIQTILIFKNKEA